MHPLLIAALTIGATLAITYYAFNEGLPFVHHFGLNAIVNNSVAVRSASPVRIAGVDVGSVTGVSADGDASRITFTLQANGQPVHADATLRIRPRVFLEGGYYLDLDPGTPAAPILKDGQTIPLAQTQTPVQFYNVLSMFDVATREQFRSLLLTLDKALGGYNLATGEPLPGSGAAGLKAALPEFKPVLNEVAWITRGLQGTKPGDVRTLLSSAADVTSTLAASDPQLADLVTSLNATSSALAASDGFLAQSVSELDSTLRAAPSALSAIDHALPPVVSFGQALDPSLKLAPPLIEGVTRAVGDLAAIVGPIERSKLLTALSSTFEQFPALLSKLDTAFPITKSVTDCLRTHVTPVLNETVPDGALSSGRPVWQDFVHFVAGLAGISQDFDANGNWLRLLAGAGTNTLTLGSLPKEGQLVASAPAGGSVIAGARPAWVGDLTSVDFQPGVPCASQRLASLASPTAAADIAGSRGGAAPLGAAQIPTTLARARATGAGR